MWCGGCHEAGCVPRVYMSMDARTGQHGMQGLLAKVLQEAPKKVLQKHRLFFCAGLCIRPDFLCE